MVAHLSSKLSHLAQSFRPQHHLNNLRNAFPSTSGHHATTASPGFFDPTNVFQHATASQNHAALGAASSAGQATGAGAGSSAGGAGGAKYHAGRGAHNWGFQASLNELLIVLLVQSYSLTTGKKNFAPTQAQQRFASQAGADTNGRQNDDEKEETNQTRRPKLLDRTRHGSTTSFGRSTTRRQSLSAADKPLLTREEAGLEAQRTLSSLEMQSRYREAFLQDQKEARDQGATPHSLDRAVEHESDVTLVQRRASVSAATSRPAPVALLSADATRSQSFVGTYPGARALHTATKPKAFDSPPPQADIPRVRRNSTSAAAARAVEQNLDGDVLPEPPRTRVPVRNAAGQVHRHKKALPRFATPEAQYRYEAILSAKETRNYDAVVAAVLRYRAVPETYSTAAHNAAMHALFDIRPPGSPVRTIVELYTDLFNHDNLQPNTLSYEIILRTLTTRDGEVRKQIEFLERRVKKKKLAGAARGPFDIQGKSQIQNIDKDVTMTEIEKKTIQRLIKEDYLTSAIEIFKALGPASDRLSNSVVGGLINACAARNRIDVALSLFNRMEQSQTRSIPFRVYDSLIEMYGRNKDADGVMTVFEGYLKARQNGLTVPNKATLGNNRLQFRAVSTKHNYSATPDFRLLEQNEQEDNSTRSLTGDAAVWRRAICALFDAGEAAQAVTLFQRMLDAADSATPSSGYLTQVPPGLVASVVAQFAKSGDFETAQQWFDRGQNQTLKSAADVASTDEPTADKALQLRSYYSDPIHASLDNMSKSAMLFTSHVLKSKMANIGDTFKLSVSEFVAVVDHCLAVSYLLESLEDKNLAIDVVLGLEKAFKQAVQQGVVEGVPRDYRLSTGFSMRMITACGNAGRFDEAVRMYLDFSNTVERAARNAAQRPEPEEGQRSLAKWIWVASDAALKGGLGMTPAKSTPNQSNGYAYETDKRPSIKQATQMITAANRIRAIDNWDWDPEIASLVVECYLRDRSAVNGDVKQLNLSGQEWFTVISAFAHLSALHRQGYVLTFDWTGFEPIIDDFAASQVKLEPLSSLSSSEGEATSYKYRRLLSDLKTGGMSSERAVAVLAVLDDVLASSLSQTQSETSFNPVKTSAAPPSPVEGDDVAITAAEESLTPSEPATSATFPTPPSTPPTYIFNTASSLAPSDIGPLSIDYQLSTETDAAVHKTKSDRAVQLIKAAAKHARFAHPEAIGRLVELLGREGKVELLKEMYLMAYNTLPALAQDEAMQSVAWVTLEDHMIIGLAQAGQLDAIGQHRDRLLQAGAAPSADAYAAMILNMKETTDDAAVALMMFEESQRFNVKPNVYLFNTLISKLSRARRAKQALEYFELMKTFGLQPSSITYGAIINACCKTGDDSSADYLFQEMVSAPGFRPRVPPYNTMIQFYVSTKPNRERALYYYNQLVKARVQPTSHTYKLLLDAYGTIGQPDLESLENVFTTLCQDPSTNVTGVHWAALINAYGIGAQDLDKAISVFNAIEEHPTTTRSGSRLPDAVVYESLLNVLLANGRADLCSQYVADMDRRQVRKTAYVANILIKAHAALNDMNSARQVFESLSDPATGVAAAGNHHVDRHPKHQHHVTNQLSASAPIFREPSTWETMIRAELSVGDGQRAIDLMQRVEQRAFPDAIVRRLRGLLIDEGLEPISLTV
ncbi:hypothetical protein OIO90_001193 [Microbotryomycetes sp. JL221]|nr:hypothetical protein OIO90_001193 [Microbotryomycetes sp. JL221]